MPESTPTNYLQHGTPNSHGAAANPVINPEIAAKLAQQIAEGRERGLATTGMARNSGQNVNYGNANVLPNAADRTSNQVSQAIPTVPVTNQMIVRLDNLIEYMHGNIQRLDSLGDRIFGDEPKPSYPKEDRDRPSGLTGEVTIRMDVVFLLADHLQRITNRLMAVA